MFPTTGFTLKYTPLNVASAILSCSVFIPLKSVSTLNFATSNDWVPTLSKSVVYCSWIPTFATSSEYSLCISATIVSASSTVFTYVSISLFIVTA